MVTNAVDHGVEPPEVRRARGKSEVGVVRVRASAKGDHAIIEVYDDGQGLDPAILREAAAGRGLLTREEAEGLSDEEAQRLILLSGLSTREGSSLTSGRGVGMDVVKTNVESLKGNIDIESEPGKFTRFTLTLPVNYSIMQGLLVESGGEVTVIPIDFVVEILHLSRDRLVHHGGKTLMPYEEGTIRLVDLAAELRYRSGASPDGEGLNVLILTCRGERLGVAVDHVLRREEIVVKSVGPFLQGMKLVAGATILRFGDPAVILNVFDLFDAVRLSRGEIRPAGRPRRPPKVIVVDDSITSRAVEKGILEKEGYAVDVAVDGQAALEMIRKGKYDLVVTDVEMPRRNGFELTATLRSDPATRKIPVVIVTSRADDAERRKGVEAGAQAYITKGTFDQNELVRTVKRLIG